MVRCWLGAFGRLYVKAGVFVFVAAAVSFFTLDEITRETEEMKVRGGWESLNSFALCCGLCFTFFLKRCTIGYVWSGPINSIVTCVKGTQARTHTVCM